MNHGRSSESASFDVVLKKGSHQGGCPALWVRGAGRQTLQEPCRPANSLHSSAPPRSSASCVLTRPALLQAHQPHRE